VRFVYVIRVPVCASASRVCPVCVLAFPVSFYRTGVFLPYRYSVCPVCVPAPPGVFVPVARVCPGSPRCLFTGIPVDPCEGSCVLARAAGRVRGSSALSSCEFLRSSVPGRIATRWCSDGGR